MTRNLTATELEHAEDDVLADSDSLTDWLAAQCMNAKPRPFYGQLYDIDPCDMTTPELVSFVFSGGQKDHLVSLALWEMRSRYLKASEAHVLERANEISVENDEAQEAA